MQITVAETVGMEGKRGAFYDHAGAMRDVVQNHMLQLLALVAMDAAGHAEGTRHQRRQAQGAAQPACRLRGADVAKQGRARPILGRAPVDGKPVPALPRRGSVAPDSRHRDVCRPARDDREAGAGPACRSSLRTGKRLPRRVTEIAVQFKLPPLQLFRTVECAGDVCDLTAAKPTVLAFRIQPDEGISLSFSAKRPGMQLDLQPGPLRFQLRHLLPQARSPKPTNACCFDALRGDATLFMRSDELEAAWEFVHADPGSVEGSAAAEVSELCGGQWRASGGGEPQGERVATDGTRISINTSSYPFFMNQLNPGEIRLEGKWQEIDGRVVENDTCRRIGELISSVLTKLATSDDGWSSLYVDNSDGRKWELTYPHNEWHGGGPPTLTHVSEVYAMKKYEELKKGEA